MPRLDIYLYENQYFTSRQRSKEAIINGCVFVDGKTITKPAFDVAKNAIIAISQTGARYVSRGGLKLEHALKNFNIDVKGKTAIDVGASTGGFTDCLLRFGVDKVYAIDVGHGQMDKGLASDSRVVLIEGINARNLEPGEIANGNIDIAVIDVSFISLKKVLLPVASQLNETGDIICLVKPQFEVGCNNVGKRGVVKNDTIRETALMDIEEFAPKIKLSPVARIKSPITGGSGNIEYLLHLKNSPPM